MIIANSYQGRVYACLKHEYESEPSRLWQPGDIDWGEIINPDEITETVEFDSIEDLEAHNFDGTESGWQIMFMSNALRNEIES